MTYWRENMFLVLLYALFNDLLLGSLSLIFTKRLVFWKFNCFHKLGLCK